MTVEETRALAELPSKEELYAKMLGSNQFTGIWYRWINQRSYGSTYKSNGCCQRSKSCIVYLQQIYSGLCTPDNVLETKLK